MQPKFNIGDTVLILDLTDEQKKKLRTIMGAWYE